MRERDRAEIDAYAQQGAAIGGEARREAQRQYGYASRETPEEARRRREAKPYDLSRHAPIEPSPPRAPAPVVPQPQAVVKGPERTGFGQKEFRDSKDARDLGVTREGRAVDPQDVYRERPVQRRRLRVSQMRSLTPEDPAT